MPFFSSVEGNFGPIAKPQRAKFRATGGTETTYSSGGKNYKSHTFTSTATLNVTTGGTIDYLVVGGGAGGSQGNAGNGGNGGGGGAGGVVVGSTRLNPGKNRAGRPLGWNAWRYHQ